MYRPNVLPTLFATRNEIVQPPGTSLWLTPEDARAYAKGNVVTVTDGDTTRNATVIDKAGPDVIVRLMP